MFHSLEPPLSYLLFSFSNRSALQVGQINSRAVVTKCIVLEK